MTRFQGVENTFVPPQTFLWKLNVSYNIINVVNVYFVLFCYVREFNNYVCKWRIFGPKRGELTGGWRKMHNAELYYLPMV
jgi:hypothetical protein